MSDNETIENDFDELNEASADKPNRCRTTFSPDKYVHLTNGEMHDHRQWGTLLEDPDGLVSTAGTAPSVEEADDAPTSVPDKTTAGTDAITKQANAAPPVPDPAQAASAPAAVPAEATQKKAASS